MPVTRVRLNAGREACLGLRPDSTAVAVDDVWAASYDLAGRPFALVRDGFTYRRGLDGRLLQKGPAIDETRPRVRRVLSGDQATATVEAARRDVAQVLGAARREGLPRELEAGAVRRLETILEMTETALARDADRFGEVYGTVGILPPDQYLSLVLQATEGCPWNACSFCDFYRGVAFRVRRPEEFRAHLRSVRAYLGPSLALRRRVFLGAGSALSAEHPRVLSWLQTLAEEVPVAPRDLEPAARRRWLKEQPAGVTGVASFLDIWSGRRKTVDQYQAYAGLGLRRVYLGLETGDSELLALLSKPGSPEEAVELVHTLHAAGLSVGVIVLVGVGGERYFEAHVRKTAAALAAMGLGGDDLLYFSEFVPHPGLEYLARRSPPDLAPLASDRCAEQRRALAAAYWPTVSGRLPRTASYDIREFVY